jgi:hypothetical protein
MRGKAALGIPFPATSYPRRLFHYANCGLPDYPISDKNVISRTYLYINTHALFRASEFLV